MANVRASGEVSVAELRSRPSNQTSSVSSSSYGSPGSLQHFTSGEYLAPSEPTRELTRDIECPSMLRTVTARTVLRGFGRVFRSQGIDRAYALSQECDKLGYFISHSWSASWLSKYITLAFHFNFWFAVVTSISMITISLIVGLLCVSHHTWDTIRESVNPSLIYVGIGLFFFIPSLLFGSELLACFPYMRTNRTRCFLDKCCINQVDPVLKRKGIEALGGFLARSEVLLILWSTDYFKRLWCAYEVAVYMSLPADGTKRRVVMIPLELVHFAMLVFGLDLIIQIVSVNFFFQADGGMPAWATQVTAIAIASLFAAFSYFFAYRWQVDQAFLRNQLAEFSLNQVECSDPSDRPLVLRDIAKRYANVQYSESGPCDENDPTNASFRRVLTSSTNDPSRQTSHVSRESSLDMTGLRAFEEYVQTKLKDPIQNALGSHACVLPYKFLLTMSLPAVWAAMGLMCYWILKTPALGDTEDVLDTDSVVLLILSKMLRAITFYPLLTAAILWFQWKTEAKCRGSKKLEFIRGLFAVILVGSYVYMFGFHYIFLIRMDADIVFYTSLPQVVLFLLVYTRLGTIVYRWTKKLWLKCRPPKVPTPDPSTRSNSPVFVHTIFDPPIVV